jgi:hypothetical protein
MQRLIIIKHTRRRRIITAPRASLHKVLSLDEIIFPIKVRAVLMRNVQICPALNAAQIQALIAVDFAESRAAEASCAALRAGGQLYGFRLCRAAGCGADVGVGSGGAVIFFGVHVVCAFSLGEADNKGGHGHLNVEFNEVSHRVELDVYDLVLEEHEADEHGVHGNGDDHKLCVEPNQRGVFLQPILLHEPDLDSPEEVPVEGGVDGEDKDLGDLVPNVVDFDKCVASGRIRMRWNPDAKDGDVNGSNEDHSAPLQVTDGASMLGDERDTIDDNLHQQLYFEDVEEEDPEQDRNTASHRVS